MLGGTGACRGMPPLWPHCATLDLLEGSLMVCHQNWRIQLPGVSSILHSKTLIHLSAMHVEYKSKIPIVQILLSFAGKMLIHLFI